MERVFGNASGDVGYLPDTLTAMGITALATFYAQHRSRIPAAALTWVLFVAAVVPQLDEGDTAGLLGGVVLGAALVGIGFLASSQIRPLAPQSTSRVATMVVASVVAGAFLGTIILGAQLALATGDRRLHAQIARFAGEPITNPLLRAYSAAVFEEVIMRLFAMSVIVWIATRKGKNPESAFRIALWISAVLFALGHFPDPTLTGLMVLVLNGLGGLLLGWFFWRWGLPYAILCHFAGDVVIQSLGPRIIGA